MRKVKAKRLTPGIYKLQETIENPVKDGRSRTWWKMPQLDKGYRFAVTKADGHLLLFWVPQPHQGLTLYPRRPRPCYELVRLMLPLLAREPDSLSSALIEVGDSERGVLGRLLRQGKVTLDDIRALYVTSETPGTS